MTTLPYAKIIMGMLIAAALLGVSFVVLRQTFQESANYYQKRDLRMLERVGRDITNGVDGLTIAAALHFDPHAMRFTLSPLGRCLVGTVWVPFDRHDRIRIDYDFVDPLQTRTWLAQMADRDAKALEASARASTAPASTREPSARRCQLRRPPGAPRPTGATLDRQLEVTLYLPVTQLLGAGNPPKRGPADRTLPQDPPISADARARSAALQQQLKAGARADLKADPSARGVIETSIETAFKSNLMRVSASRDAPEIGATAVAAHFAAIKLFSAVQDGKPRTLLWQTGEAPPLLDQSKLTDVDRTALGLLGVADAPSKDAAKQEQADKEKAEAQAFAAPAASVTRIGNLVLYQRDYVGPSGLDCPRTNPCKLVAVRDAAAVDTEARRIDGVRATWLLIGLLTAIGCVPLLQLFLNKRLDPIDRLGQCLLWLSLGFLTASATISAMAILASGMSMAAGDRAADDLADGLSRRLNAEVRASVHKIREVGTELAASVAPPVEPFYDLAPPPPPQPSLTMLVDAVVLFDALGQMAENKPTMTLLAAPSHAANVFDRRYFRAAASGDLIQLTPNAWDVLDAWTTPPSLAIPPRARNRNAAWPDPYANYGYALTVPPFTIEQLFSKPDGVRKTAIATPLPSSLDCGPQASKAARAKRRGEEPCIAVATGTLQTFLHQPPQPGLAYAVVDRSLAEGPDVLFHSDRSNELVSRFIDDVDDADAVTRLIQRARIAGVEPFATRYQSRPVRLHATLLVPGLPWVLVAIEDRDQAGYGIWRDVVFGYTTWFVVNGIVALALLPAFLFWRKGVDRQPLMWLWPDRILTIWRPRFQTDAHKKQELEDARGRFTIIALLALLGVGLVFCAPAPARIPMALLVVILAASARASFRGGLASDDAEARDIDRWTSGIGIAFATLALSAHVGVALRTPWPEGLWQLPSLLFALLVLAWFIAPLLGPAVKKLVAGRRMPWHLVGRAHGLRKGSWVILLLAASAAPAAAGFLDSHASNARWATLEWNAARTAFYNDLQDRRRAIQHSFDGRYELHHYDSHVARSSASLDSDGSLFTQGVHLLGLDEKVRQSSRMLPSEWALPGWPWVIAAAVTFLALCVPLLMFRLQFFQRTEMEPLELKGLPIEALPNLIRSVVPSAVEHARQPGGHGLDVPVSPFVLSFARRHLIVGARASEEYEANLCPAFGVAHVDLLAPEEPTVEDPSACGAVLIHGFNAALLRSETYALGLNRLERLVLLQEDPKGRHLHLFLFAASEPTDRILATDSLRGGADSDDPVPEAYRWAEILDTFSLYNVAPEYPIAAANTFERELKVVGSRAAGLLLLPRATADLLGPNADFRTKPDHKLIPFLTDFLADHYKLLWETSSRDEQIILFEIACGSHLKMHDSFALRSLEARRLVARAPEYQLMNQSFTRYVRQVGRPVELRQAAREEGGTDRLFPLLQIPVAIVLGSGLLLLLLVTPGETGFATALPALAAALPSLVSTWLRGGRPAAS